MNDKFKELTKEKQDSIINAAISVFARTDYQHANTDDIAAKAGISKGSLFYYFENKANLFQFIFSYIYDFAYEEMVKADIWGYTDFFELCEVSLICKLQFSRRYPELFEFIMRAYLNPDDKIIKNMQNFVNDKTKDIFDKIINNIDFSKFRSGIDMEKCLNIIYWTAEGYLKKKIETIKISELNFEEVSKEFRAYMDIFRTSFYKEEFHNGINENR